MLSQHPFIQISHATPEHLPAILAIQSLCYHAIEPESAASMLSKITISPGSCFISSINHDIQGYLLSFPACLNQPPALDEETYQLPDHPDCLYLHDLAIHPEARGTGCSKLLIQNFFYALHQSGFSNACLVSIQNSVPFWQNHGFVPVIPDKPLQDKLRSYGDDATYMEHKKSNY